MDKKLHELGLARRKATLGADYVNMTETKADDFNRPFLDFVTEYCWGFGWGDDRLDAKTRSMLNLTMIAALNRMEEWELHFRGAIRNGVSEGELQAIIHQIGIYCGIPAGVSCMRIARKVLAEEAKS